MLRLMNIEAFGFWTDEGLTPLRAGYSLSQILRNDIIIQGFLTKDTHPSFFYMIVHFSHQLFGETDFAYRFPSVLAGVLLVPVMYQFGRRLRGMGLGLLAAVLTAVNPLQIWYANEARMYTLFVLLLALASYVLWRALTGAPLVRALILYLILAGLAFYTHYTAVFLIAVQALFWVWLLWQHGQKKLIIGAAIVGILAAIPLVPYTIPRLLGGKEANFFYVSLSTMLQDVVRFFNLGLTVDFSQPAIKLINIVAGTLLLLGLYAAKAWKCRLFLLSYLLAVVFGLFAGSLLFKPMYQGVRHIMAGSPAFILLTGWGVVFAWEQARQTEKIRWGWATVGVVSLFVMLIGPLVSLNNLYTNPDIYAKDDFRDLIAQMEANAGSNDVIVYNNAIHLPLHEHYQTRDDVAVTAVPRYPTLASKTAVPDLTHLAETYERIWFVTDPPADKRDEESLTRQWLEENLVNVAHNRAHARTTIVESLTFVTNPVAITTVPENGTRLDSQWPNLPTLHSIQIEDTSPITRPTLWFSLIWGETPARPDAYLRFSLQDQNGQEWDAKIQPLVADTNSQWTANSLNQLAYKFTLPTGLPPGDYTLWGQPLAQDRTTTLGDARLLSELSISLQNSFGADTWPENHHILFSNGMELLDWQLGDTEVPPGHNLPLTLYWQANEAGQFDNIQYELAVVEPDGTVLRTQTDSPGADWLTAWPADTPIMERTGLYFRPETRPGTYQLRWQLIDDGEVVSGRPFWQPWHSETITLGEVTVVPWPLLTEPPDDVTHSEAVFGPIRLHGYRENQADAGQVAFDLVWQTQTVPDDNYFLFVHLVDADGNIVAQTDRVPGNTLRPTGGWREGEVISDSITLTLPP
ncbi:MAG: glycosyltransferase family 39 protein, partial [Anaerolineae bacterium]|nr:glycosyltransferase family 39 protein [Anaerolineae bacterium]